jgi:NAD(P)-dependent dehydrogenase (short-subunit alcohol dehydrogenase family)
MTSRALDSTAAVVIVTGVSSEDVGRVLRDLADGPGRVAHFHGDLTGDANVEALIEFIREQFGERPAVS